MQYEQILAMSEKERTELRKACHQRAASAARNSDPPNIEDLLTLNMLDEIADGYEEALPTSDQHRSRL